MTGIVYGALLLGACASSYPCISSNADPVFEVLHTGGWNPYWIVRSIALLNDDTIVVTSRGEQRCAKPSLSEIAELHELVLKVSTRELGRPIVGEDARNLGLKVGANRTDVAYGAAANELTPEGAAFIRRLDVIAQEHFGSYYDHTLTRLEAPRHRFW